MRRVTLFLLICILWAVPVLAQETPSHTYTSADGMISFRYPETWHVQDIGDASYFHVILENASFAVDLSLYNLWEVCGESPFVVPTLSCETENASGVLDYIIRTRFSLNRDEDLPGEIELFSSRDRSAAVYRIDGAIATYVLSIGEGIFLLGDIFGYGQVQPEYDQLLRAILESFTYGFDTVGNFTLPQISPAEGVVWQQSIANYLSTANIPSTRIISMAVDAEDRIYLGLLAQPYIIVLSSEGEFLYFIESDYLPSTNDMIIDQENRIWAVSYFGLHIFDGQGNYLQSWQDEPFIPVQIERDQEGNIYLLEFMRREDYTSEARITILSPAGDIIRQFRIDDPETFAFYDDAAHSGDSLTVSAEGNIYVLNYRTSMLRIFDSEGQILIPSLIEDMDGPIATIAINEDRHLYVAGQPGIMVYDQAGELIHSNTEATYDVAFLSNNDLVTISAFGFVQRLTAK